MILTTFLAEEVKLCIIPFILAELKCEQDDIVDFELNVCDTQNSQIGGVTNEFIFSGRLDNLYSSFCALKALIDASKDSFLKKHKGARAIALFDNEEVGSVSTSVGGGMVMFEAIKRATLSSKGNSSASSEGDSDVIERCLAKPFLVSADMAHTDNMPEPLRNDNDKNGYQESQNT